MILLSFEGIDGCGKSTQAQLLVERLREAGREVLPVREPGGAEVSEQVRRLLLDPELSITPRAELLLFSAARAQLVEERIRPALKKGMIVVCDRFYDSTTAYQGAGRGVAAPEWLQAFNAFVTGGLIPARTYLVDVPVAVARDRLPPAGDRMESGDAAFYERVAAGYRALAAQEPERIVRVDGTRTVEELQRTIWKDVASLMRET